MEHPVSGHGIAQIGLAQDEYRGQHDQHAFEKRREILRLVMAVRMFVRGLGAPHYGNECGRRVTTLNRVGKKSLASGQMIGAAHFTPE